MNVGGATQANKHAAQRATESNSTRTHRTIRNKQATRMRVHCHGWVKQSKCGGTNRRLFGRTTPRAAVVQHYRRCALKQGASGRDHGELLRLLFTDSNRRGIRVIDQACPQKPLFYDLCLPSDRYSITPQTIPRRRRFRWTHSTPARPSIKAINQRRARHQPAINVWASDCILVGHQTL